MFSITFSSVTEEIFALTALRNAVAPAALSPAIISRDQLPALRVIIRSSFSRLVAYFMPYIHRAYIREADTNPAHPYDPSQALDMRIDFGIYTQGLDNESLMVVKRYLEHLLALMTLSRIYAGIYPGYTPEARTAAGTPILSPAASQAANTYAAEASSLLDVIRNYLLTSQPLPATLLPAYY